MSTLVTATVKSNSSSPIAFQNSSGTEVGRMCRAWVNFNGTGTVAIRAQFNVSSITDNGTGNYTVNFTTAMPDTNGCVVTGLHNSDNGGGGNTWPGFSNNNVFAWGWTYTAGALRMRTAWGNNVNHDGYHIYAALFR